jgi:hypothetical protein
MLASAAEGWAIDSREGSMTPSTEVLIGDPDGQQVLIRVLSRNHPGLFDYWDANWVACELQISAGGFRAGFRADLRSEEFQRFLDEAEAVNRSLEGTATFSTMEQQIALTLSLDGRGHVLVDGEARDAPGSQNCLRFGFEIDQTYLREICRSLEVILRAFPVVGSST